MTTNWYKHAVHLDKPWMFTRKELHESLLFHGTSEDINGEIGEGIEELWVAETPAIAQNYIPESGSLMLFSLPWSNKPEDHIWPKDAQTIDMVRQMGFEPDIKEVDRTGRTTSWWWKNEKVPSYGDMQRWIEKDLGYKPEENGMYRLKTTYDGGNTTILPANYRMPGKLYLLVGKDKLKLFDMAKNNEGDLMEPDYNKYDTFEKMKKAGYDGVRINDFAQSKYWGNMGHRSILIFPSGLAKLRKQHIDASNFDWSDENKWGQDTPEFTAWHKDRVVEALKRGEPVPQSVIDEYPELKKNKTASSVKTAKQITLYQGTSSYNKGSRFYTPDRKWARQFTQSGRDFEIKMVTMSDSTIYRPDPLPEATSATAIDVATEEARSKGFSAVWVDEGTGQPNSVYVIPSKVKTAGGTSSYYGPKGDVGHDYDPNWDFSKDRRQRREMRMAFDSCANEIAEMHMSEFRGVFTRFRLFYGRHDEDALAKYVDGTYSEPVIIVDLGRCEDGYCEFRDVMTRNIVAMSTLMHELWHAVQDGESVMGKSDEKYDEDEAEEFARRFASKRPVSGKPSYPPSLTYHEMTGFILAHGLRDWSGELDLNDAKEIAGHSDAWILTEVPLSLFPWVADPSRRNLSTGTPPIILKDGGDYEVLDGKHRIGMAKGRGDQTIWAYVGEWFDTDERGVQISSPSKDGLDKIMEKVRQDAEDMNAVKKSDYDHTWYKSADDGSQMELSLLGGYPDRKTKLRSDPSSIDRTCISLAVMLLQSDKGRMFDKSLKKTIYDLKRLREQGKLQGKVGSLIVAKLDIAMNHPVYGLGKGMTDEQKTNLKQKAVDRLVELMNEVATIQ